MNFDSSILEQYLSAESKEEYLNKFVKGSNEDCFFRALHSLNESRDNSIDN